jgi:hypothetical protein
MYTFTDYVGKKEVTRVEGACMFSLDLLASECSNMNGSEILKGLSVTNRAES